MPVAFPALIGFIFIVTLERAYEVRSCPKGTSW